MICLRIVPVQLADPAAAAKRRDGAGVLVPVPGATAWMEHGEGGEGWYTAYDALFWMMWSPNVHFRPSGVDRPKHVVCDDTEIVAAVGHLDGQLVALIVSHFSSPVDDTDYFQDEHLLTLPDTQPVPDALVHDVAQMLRRAA